MKNKINKFTRREFISGTVKGTLGLIGYSFLEPYAAKAGSFIGEKSRIVIIKHNKAGFIDSSKGQNPYQVNQNTIQLMVDEGIRRLTGINDTGEAYKSLFPGITANKKISIKVNCIARGGGPYVGSNKTGLATHPELAYSIAKSLIKMQFNGNSFPAENITIWDRADIELINSGYVINRNNPGIRCYGTTEKVVNNVDEGYGREVFRINGSDQKLSKILIEESDYLINVPVLKNHSSAGVTLSLKNLYGAINNPDVPAMHDNNSNPAVAILNTLPPIKEKLTLCICDAIYGVVTAGAAGAPQVQPNQLLLSKDPVALDTVGRNLLKSLGTTQYSLDMAKYIDAAATPPYNIGTNDLNSIDQIYADITK